MHLYFEIKKRPHELSAKLDALASRARSLTEPEFIDFYYKCRDDFQARDHLTNAAMFIFLNRHCWNGLYRENADGRFNTPIGSHHSLQLLPNIDDILEASASLQRASLQLTDFEEVLSFAKSGDFLYLDPPYVPLSPTARFINYQAQSFTWHDQVRLKRALYELTDRGIDFMLSNNSSKGIANFYEGFHVKEVAVNRAINSIASRRSGKSELLVSNFTWESDSASSR